MRDERTTLQKAMPTGPVYSEPFDFGQGRKYKFRLLDSMETMWAIVAAQKRTLTMIRDEFGDEELSRDLLKAHAPNADLQTWWTELYCLQAALCNDDGSPVIDGDPAARADEMADRFSVVECHELANLYTQFADEHDPTQFSEDDIRGIVEDGKKNLTLSYWRQFGSNTLRRCNHTLATELVSCMRRLEAMETATEGDE